ncbi:uncharacterized protein DSM5745_08057 [Aspergillus mulundensis]|uniref:Uncharacterized protein n=1 Tax=Aspergillus mulundensis TaxID=1810919 RepID=A0A3D8R987_9EURO|nr:Uncharacterized protein DSM5745_08057 [Aspergillus mulundensis]RDW70546.1 Uncharacterized protein DSM5745_08057 [Aspergillus mulundensis]
MTTRGRPPVSLRPTTPPDPTLATRPVPRTRTFTPHSYGPGAAPNIKDLVRNLNQVRADSDPATYLNPLDAQYSHILPDGIHQLLKEIIADETIFTETDEIISIDPTWGFYAFLVDYDADTLRKIPLAMHNLVEATRRTIRAQSTTAYADEALRRFKLDVVQDEAALADASADRIREEFRAHLRGVRQLGDDGVIRGAARNYACLVLDRAVVLMLADLAPAFSEDLRGDWRALRGKTIPLVDAWWERPAANGSAYRGVDCCSVPRVLV